MHFNIFPFQHPTLSFTPKCSRAKICFIPFPTTTLLPIITNTTMKPNTKANFSRTTITIKQKHPNESQRKNNHVKNVGGLERTNVVENGVVVTEKGDLVETKGESFIKAFDESLKLCSFAGNHLTAIKSLQILPGVEK